MVQIRDIGEQGLLKRLQAFCPADLVGDDAAVLTVPPERSLVVTTDVLVDGVHFSDRTTSPVDAGWRAMAANLSDLAAMGATPLGVTVGLGLPGDRSVDWVEQLYQGMIACLQPFNTAIVGGDVVRSPITTVAITAFGTVEPELAIYRHTAQPGAAIVVTGWHGLSRAGLELLLHPERGSALEADEQATLIRAHQRPQPRLDVLPVLRSLDALSQSIAGMDSSDGLADALCQICRASQVGARISQHQMPIHPALLEWVGPDQALDWALYGGEDFELVLCLPPLLATALVRELGAGAAIIGAIAPAPDVLLVDHAGNPIRSLTLEQGFQHFQSEPGAAPIE